MNAGDMLELECYTPGEGPDDEVCSGVHLFKVERISSGGNVVSGCYQYPGKKVVRNGYFLMSDVKSLKVTNRKFTDHEITFDDLKPGELFLYENGVYCKCESTKTWNTEIFGRIAFTSRFFMDEKFKLGYFERNVNVERF